MDNWRKVRLIHIYCSYSLQLHKAFNGIIMYINGLTSILLFVIDVFLLYILINAWMTLNTRDTVGVLRSRLCRIVKISSEHVMQASIASVSMLACVLLNFQSIYAYGRVVSDPLEGAWDIALSSKERSRRVNCPLLETR